MKNALLLTKNVNDEIYQNDILLQKFRLYIFIKLINLNKYIITNLIISFSITFITTTNKLT